MKATTHVLLVLINLALCILKQLKDIRLYIV